jgi:transcriptional regulator with XRE-family HTH domain
MTQERLAEIAGLHRNYVGSVERGERNISIEALERWLKALGMSWEDFGGRLDTPR